MGTVAEWKERFNVTAPADREKAETLVRALYMKAGANTTNLKVTWVNNPQESTPGKRDCIVFLGPFTWGLEHREPENEIAELFYALAGACFGVMFLEDEVFICERPSEINLTEDGRWHCETAPVVKYRNGEAVFGYDGIIVPEKVIMAPETITIEDVDNTTNQEIRRIFMERMGQERYFKQREMTKIQEDDFGELWARPDHPDEPKVVRVVNSTPNPDGSRDIYYLWTDPRCESAHEAVALSFNRTVETYNPEFET